MSCCKFDVVCVCVCVLFCCRHLMFCPATFIWLVNRRDNSIDVFSMSNTYTTYLRYLAHYCFCVCVSVDVLRALPLNGLGGKKDNRRNERAATTTPTMEIIFLFMFLHCCCWIGIACKWPEVHRTRNGQDGHRN